MRAAIRRYRIDAGTTDKALQQFNESLVPTIMKEVSGIIAYYAMDAGGGVVVAISICENQAGIEETGRLAANWIKQHLAMLFPDSLDGLFIGFEEALQGPL